MQPRPATEFADFVEKLRDGRAAWEAISLRTDEAFSQPVAPEWKLPAASPARRSSPDEPASVAAISSSAPTAVSPLSSSLSPAIELPEPSATSSTDVTPTATALPTPSLPAPKAVPLPIDTRRARPTPLRPALHRPSHKRQASTGSSTSNPSPLSPSFAGSPWSAATGFSAFSQLSSVSLNTGPPTADSASFPLTKYGSVDPTGGPLSSSANERERERERFQMRSVCGGACIVGTAMCEVCAAAQRRGSLGNALDERDRLLDEDEDDEELEGLELAEDADVWPPHPFQPTKLAVTAAPVVV